MIATANVRIVVTVADYGGGTIVLAGRAGCGAPGIRPPPALRGPRDAGRGLRGAIASIGQQLRDDHSEHPTADR
ncbi:hypothetical protein GCM10009792_08180 [Microcella alkalica]